VLYYIIFENFCYNIIMKKFTNPFVALRSRNFRIYWLGMNISLIGGWMQSITIPWLTLKMTSDPFLVSLVAALQFAPALFLSLFAGAFIDRHNKKHVMLATQSAHCIIALLYFLLFHFGRLDYATILILSLCSGITQSVDSPARQTIIYELLDDKSHLTNAIAVNSMSFNIARIIGPAIAGVVIATVGMKICFLINFISFFAVLLALTLVRVSPDPMPPSRENIWLSIKDGIAYILRTPILVYELAILLVFDTFIPNYNVTISAYTKFMLSDFTDSTYGYLMSFLGVGAFFGALFVALTSHRPSVNTTRAMPLLSAVCLIMCGTHGSFAWCAFWITICGFGFVATAATLNSIIQINTNPQYRGRVMSVHSLIFQGTTPFGALLVGYVCRTFGANWGLYFSGAMVIILLTVVFYRLKI